MIAPQLATLAAAAPAGEDWLHELKYDGYRILARIEGGQIDLFTRRGNNWTARFPAAAAAIADLGLNSGYLDGEIVALNERGGTDFQRLQNWLKEGADGSLIYYAFDVPYLNGYDLTASPLIERKELLQSILAEHDPKNSGLIRYSEHIHGDGAKVLDYACQSGMEGIVSKRADSPYVPRRTSSWLKIKCQQRQEFVIGGYTHPAGSRHGFGSLLVGYYRGGDLIYAGRVGTGFTQQSLAELSQRLKNLETDRPAFVNPPRRALKQRAEWVRPELVAEVTFGEWTSDGILRHPSFQGLREDKSPREIVREPPSAVPANSGPNHAIRSAAMSAKNGASQVAGVTLSNPDRVLYPEQELTKLDLARYYESIADWILPHLVDRPLTMVRCPTGRTGQCFYQKHLTETMPKALRGVSIKEKTVTRKYVVIDDLAGLVTLVQRGVLELHPWGSRADDLEHPDRLVIDLDPGAGVEWKAVIEAARRVRDYLAALGLTSFVRTTGGKGLHVVAPLVPRATWDEHKQFAESIARALAAQWPDKYLATMSKAHRRGKVFVDYLRNQRGATAIVSYSTRAREGVPVATPLKWEELTARLKPERFTVATIPKRLAKLAADPWEGFFELRQSLTAKILEASRSVLKEFGD
jgi:bifunctional non-homologous end joining protein LigD